MLLGRRRRNKKRNKKKNASQEQQKPSDNNATAAASPPQSQMDASQTNGNHLEGGITNNSNNQNQTPSDASIATTTPTPATEAAATTTNIPGTSETEDSKSVVNSPGVTTANTQSLVFNDASIRGDDSVSIASAATGKTIMSQQQQQLQQQQSLHSAAIMNSARTGVSSDTGDMENKGDYNASVQRPIEGMESASLKEGNVPNGDPMMDSTDDQQLQQRNASTLEHNSTTASVTNLPPHSSSSPVTSANIQTPATDAYTDDNPLSPEIFRDPKTGTSSLAPESTATPIPQEEHSLLLHQQEPSPVQSATTPLAPTDTSHSVHNDATFNSQNTASGQKEPTENIPNGAPTPVSNPSTPHPPPSSTDAQQTNTSANPVSPNPQQQSSSDAPLSQQQQQQSNNPSDDPPSQQQQQQNNPPPPPSVAPYLRYLCFPSSSKFNNLTKNIFGFSNVEQRFKENPQPNAQTPQDSSAQQRHSIPVCVLSEKRETLSLENCLLPPIQKEQDKLINLSILNQGIKYTLQRYFLERVSLFQLDILRKRVDFTHSVNEALLLKNKKKQLNALKKLRTATDSAVNQHLNQSESATGVDRKLTEQLFVLALKQRQILDQLMLEQKKKKLLNVTNCETWKSQLKYSLEQNNVIIRTSDAAMYYSWEYQNPSRPLVQTQNMDKLFAQLLQMWAQYRLCLIRGEMGCYSAIQKFTQSVGYHAVTQDCSKIYSWEELEQILCGVLSSSGCLLLQNVDSLAQLPSPQHQNALLHLYRVMDSINEKVMNRVAQVQVGQFQFQMTGPFLVVGISNPGHSGTAPIDFTSPYPECTTAFIEMEPYNLEEIIEVALLQKHVPAGVVSSYATGWQQFMFTVCQSYSSMPHYDLGLRETFSIIDAIEVKNAKKIQDAFYAALYRIHLPKLSRADVPKFKKATTKWLKKCAIPKPSPQEAQFKKLLRQSKTPELKLSVQEQEKLMQLYILLERKPTILLCKDPANVEKLREVFLQTYQQVHPNTKLMLEKTTRATKKASIVGKRADTHPTSTLLKEAYFAHKNNESHHYVVTYQGYIKSSWFSALQGIFDNNTLSFSNGERIIIAPTVRFLFVTSSEELQESLPLYYFGKCAIVYVD